MDLKKRAWKAEIHEVKNESINMQKRILFQ